MFEIIKAKYRNLLNDNSIENLVVLDEVLTSIQNILIKNNVYQKETLLQAIEPLKKIDDNLYSIVKQDITLEKLLLK